MRSFFITNYLISFFLAFFVYSSFYARAGGPFFVIPYWPKSGPLFHLAITHFFINVFYSHFLLLKAIKNQRGIIRNQAFYIFLGTSIGYIAGSTNYFAWYRILIPPFLNILVSFYVASVAFAITKHELMDIRVVIGRGVAYGIAGALLVASFVGLNLIKMPLPVIVITNALLGLFWAWGAHRLRDIIQTPLEEKWITGWYDPVKVMNAITKDLVSAVEREDVFKIIAQGLKERIKIKSAPFLLGEKDHEPKPLKYVLFEEKGGRTGELKVDHPLIQFTLGHRDLINFDRLGAEIKESIEEFKLQKNSLLLPLFSSDSLEGAIILGPKISEDPYSEKDYTLLRTVLNQAQVVLDRIRPYEEVKENYERSLKAAEQSSRLAALGTLALGVAHEIRNPMGAMNSYAQMLNERLEDKDFLKNFAAVTQRSIQRVLNIVDKMLRYGKPQKAEIKPLQIAEVLEDALSLLNGRCTQQNIKVIKNLPTLPSVSADPNQLNQVFFNLLLNAIEAMPQGGNLEIKSALQDNLIEIKIKDSGPGIPSPMLEQIFNPFFTTKANGTGLGLSTVFRILESYQGKIKIDSQEGKGTTVTVLLPQTSSL